MEAVKLTKNESRALDQAKLIGDWFTPTMLGLALGHPHVAASSRMAPAIKRLTELGYLERQAYRQNVVQYRVTEIGNAHLQ